MEDDSPRPDTPDAVADHLARLAEEARSGRRRTREDNSGRPTTPPPSRFETLSQEEHLIRVQVTGAGTPGERTIYEQRLAAILAEKQTLIDQAVSLGLVGDLDSILNGLRPFIERNMAVPQAQQNAVDQALAREPDNTPPELRGLRRAYFNERMAQLKALFSQAERPEGMPTNLTFTRNEGERRKWLDDQFEIREFNPNTQFTEANADQMIESVRWSTEAQMNHISNKPATSEEQRTRDLKKLEDSFVALRNEIRARHWIHNLHQNMLGGNFKEAGDYFRDLPAYLPTLYGLKNGVADMLLAIEGTTTLPDGTTCRSGNYEYYRKNEEGKSEVKKGVKEANGQANDAGIRIAERILVSLGVAVTASIRLVDSRLPGSVKNLPIHEQVEWVKSLSWEDQMVVVDFKNSFKGVPNDMVEALFFGFAMKKGSDSDVDKQETPRSHPRMLRNMNFPIVDYLATAKRKAGEQVVRRHGRDETDVWGDDPETVGDPATPNIELLVKRINDSRDERGAFSGSGIETDDIDNVTAATNAAEKKNPIGPTNDWSNALNGYKEFISEYKPFMKNPSNTQKIKEAVKNISKIPADKRQEVLKTVAINIADFMTKDRHRSYPNLPDLPESAGSIIFSLLAKQIDSPLTPKSMRELEDQFYGTRRGGLKAKAGEVSDELRWAADIGGAVGGFFSDLLKLISK